MRTAPGVPPGPLDALREPGFRWLLGSNFLQFLCFQVLSLGMVWLLTYLTDSRSVIGIVGMAQGGALFLCSPVGGVMVDRFPKRRLLLLGRLVITAVAFSVATLIALDRIAIWHLVLASVLAGGVMAVTGPATQTFVAELVGRLRLPKAIALNANVYAVAQTLGQSAGGLVVGLIGVGGAYLLASSGLLAAVGLLLAIPVSKQALVRAGQRASPVREFADGLAYIRARPALLLTMLGVSMAVFNGAFFVMRPVFARWVLGVGPEAFGLLQATAGLGTIAAALAAVFLPSLRRYGVWITGSMLAYALCMVAYSYAFSFTYLLVIEFLTGFVGQLWNVWAVTGFQLAVPEEMRGRVISLLMMFTQMGFLGHSPVGQLADAVGDQLALRVFGLIPACVLAGMLLFGWRTLRRM
jgi:MFS family permease